MIVTIIRNMMLKYIAIFACYLYKCIGVMDSIRLNN